MRSIACNRFPIFLCHGFATDSWS